MSGKPDFTCTCLPLNRKLIAHLLKVDEGSVHEQGCVERAIVTAVNLFPLYEAVREAAIAVEPDTYDTREGDALRAALDALQAAEDAL